MLRVFQSKPASGKDRQFTSSTTREVSRQEPAQKNVWDSKLQLELGPTVNVNVDARRKWVLLCVRTTRSKLLSVEVDVTSCTTDADFLCKLHNEYQSARAHTPFQAWLTKPVGIGFVKVLSLQIQCFSVF